MWYSVFVGGILWGFFRQVCICCLLSSPFVIPLTITLKGGREGLLKHLFSFRQVPHFQMTPFWIQFKWWKVDEILHRTTNFKSCHKFTVPLLSHDHYGSQSHILLNTSLLNWIPRTVVQRCKKLFSHSKEMFGGLLHFVLPKKQFECNSFTLLDEAFWC